MLKTVREHKTRSSTLTPQTAREQDRNSAFSDQKYAPRPLEILRSLQVQNESTMTAWISKWATLAMAFEIFGWFVWRLIGFLLRLTDACLYLEICEPRTNLIKASWS